MIDLFEAKLTSIFRKKGFQATQFQHGADDLLALANGVVEKVDPHIRMVRGYQKRLLGPVDHALEYIDALVESIPSAVDINRRTFGTDPRVHAFFVNVEDLQKTFSRSSELQDFLENTSANECCALMCMRKTERKTFGMELTGDTVRKDVAQVSVSFSDHQVHSPADSEHGVREGLKHCMFENLLDNAVERLSVCRASVQHLDGEYRRLHSRLRSYEAGRTAKLSGGACGESECAVADVRRRIEEIEGQRSRSCCRGAEDSLIQVTEILDRPDRLVRLQHSTLRMDKLGIKVNDATSKRGNAIDLVEVELGGADRRIVVLAKFPRQEVLPRTGILDNTGRYLDA